MKILITGANGFLGKELAESFSEEEITLLSRHHEPYVDLLNKKMLDDFFKNKKFDYVFHTAVVGGKRDKKDELNVLIDNLQMFKNLVNFKNNYNYMFNFCSGAALKGKNNSVNNAVEEDIFNTLPADYYGLSKNIIAREISKIDNIFNFRLFGCFGKHEEQTRLFKNLFFNIKNNEQPIIYQNKFMDYISTSDVAKILRFYISKNKNIIKLPKDINLVYNKKMKLSEMYELVKSFTNSNVCCKIVDENLGVPYTGNGSKLNNLDIKLSGLEKSLLELKQYVFR